MGRPKVTNPTAPCPGVPHVGYPLEVIDLRLLRDNPDVVRASQVARGDDPALVDQALDADSRRRSALTDFEQMRAEQKSLGKQVAQAKGDEKTALLAHTKQLAEGVKARQKDADDAEAQLKQVLFKISNVIEGAPPGGEDDYVVLREEGTIRDLDRKSVV